MDFIEIVKKAIAGGIVCSIIYHGLSLLMGNEIQWQTVAVFTVTFTLVYAVWLFMVSLGRKK